MYNFRDLHPPPPTPNQKKKKKKGGTGNGELRHSYLSYLCLKIKKKLRVFIYLIQFHPRPSLILRFLFDDCVGPLFFLSTSQLTLRIYDTDVLGFQNVDRFYRPISLRKNVSFFFLFFFFSPLIPYLAMKFTFLIYA